MQTGLQPLQHQCGISLLPSRFSTRQPLRCVRAESARSTDHLSVRCSSSDSDRQQQASFSSHLFLRVAFAAALSLGSLTTTEVASARTAAPVKKADPYEVLCTKQHFRKTA